jgi:trehalose synthase
VWPELDPRQVLVVPPCIDVLSAKNQPLDDRTRDAILQASGLIAGAPANGAAPSFWGSGGQLRRVHRQARMVEDAPMPAAARLVTQVSRWDRLKDPVGVLTGFAGLAASSADGHDLGDVHLVLAGPDVEGVDDDPEGAEVLAEVQRARSELPAAVRRRTHLASLPMADVEENGAIVNALQRRSDVVVQKSRAEGFGLTVAEAMFKGRAVVATRVGGIQDQIVHGESGLLLDDPEDLAALGRAVAALLADPSQAARLGAAAHERVCENYLPVHHFAREADLIERSLDHVRGVRASTATERDRRRGEP